MKIKAFLYLPETDAAFEMLHHNPDSFNEIINELYAIKYKLKKNKDYDIFYDSANVNNFLNVANGYIASPYLAGIRGQLQHILKFTGKDVNLPMLRNNQHIYANWIITVNVNNSPFIIAESAESRVLDNVDATTICLCLGSSLNTDRDELHVIKDSVNEVALPTLISVKAANSDIAFVRWITTLAPGHFKLSRNNDFEPLDKFWKKERIYRHRATGNHWYFDFFHKDNKIHYEVFDNTGNTYFGEADINGVLIAGTNVGNKKISHIL
jgi:hypothetical protein